MEESLRCASSQKDLAYVKDGKLFLWCKRCCIAHQFTREQVLRMMKDTEVQQATKCHVKA